MALVASSVSSEPRSWSLGPWKVQLLNFSVANTDTSGTATADSLSTVIWASVSGISQTAAPTFSGNVITLAFADPGATRHGQILVIGR